MGLIDEEAFSAVTFIVIDFETVTPSGRRPEPTEIAAVAVRPRDGAFVETGRFTSLIRPPGDVAITRFDTAQTGITAEMVAQAPDAATVMSTLERRLTQPPYLLVAHNAPYEAGLIFDRRDSCPALARTPLLDTVRLARAAYPDMRRHRLDDLVRHLKITPPVDRHRALPDVLVTLAVFTQMLEGTTWTSLAQLQAVAGITPRALDIERETAKGRQDPLFP
ncbi:hypothetical protein GCM10022252_48110 [Streptosporangium oxazolinicum]|uniref:Exonuclease domain-containing protein n=1 Tax=Streptosporangium oxazolinicum TaxID=909287 RepID=A0ABP8B4S3_9ACTN